MKSIFALTALFISMTAHATGGIDCDSKDGKIGFGSGEAIQGGIETVALNGGILKGTVTFNTYNGDNAQVSAAGPGMVYMGAKDDVVFTLNIPKAIPEGKLAEAMLFVAKGSKIQKTLVYCANESYDGGN